MKRMLALILALTMVMALVACGGDKPTGSTPDKSATTSTPTEPSKPADSSKPTEPSKPAEPEKPAEPKVVNEYQKNESFSLFPQGSKSAYDDYILDRIIANLYNYLPVDGKAVMGPELADGEPVDVNGDGKTWNIKIKKAAQWQNGDPINADTFLFTLKTALDPKLVLNTTTVAKNNIEIVNAAAYYQQAQEGKSPVAWEDVGIKKVDENTIQIQTVAAVKAADVMKHFATKQTMPLHEGLFTKLTAADGTTTYGSSADTVLACGAYTLEEWVNESLHVYQKNPTYVLADLVNIDTVNEHILKDDNTILQMFESGQLDRYGVSTASKEKFIDDPRLIAYPSRTSSTLEVNTANTENPILGNYNFRMAMYYAIDRQALTKVANYIPNLSVITTGAGGMEDGTLYQTVAYANNTYLAQDTYGYDPKLAKEYFDKALTEMNQTSAEVTFLVTEGGYSKSAEYLQEAWPKIFGEGKIKVNIDIQTTGVISERRSSWPTNPNGYELAFSGFAPSTTDHTPAYGARYYTSHYPQRNAPHENAEADELYTKAINAATPEERYELTMQLEKALQKTMTAIPVVNGSSLVVYADHYVMAIDPETYTTGSGWLKNYADIVK